MDRVLFVNVTRQCNVRCDRCYLTPEHRKEKERLSPLLLQKLISHDWFSAQPLVVIWEGGEASLIGKQRFNDLVDRCKSVLPDARQTMVTNLLAAPNWLIDLCHEHFDSKVETTLALDRKYSLSGSRDVFLESFSRSFKRFKDAGIECPINIETNCETVEAGPGALLDFLEGIGAKTVEFDISVDFKKFFDQPAYDLSGYPLLPASVDYASLSDYLMQFWLMAKERGLDKTISSSIFEQCLNLDTSMMFGVQKSMEFITINPDGTVTTNPLFSDLTPTYLGSVAIDSADEVIGCAKRERFLRYEMRRTSPCLSCKYFKTCSAGPSHVAVQDGSGECAGMKRLWDYFRN